MAKHYITLDGENKTEIPPERLEDIEQLFAFFRAQMDGIQKKTDPIGWMTTYKTEIPPEHLGDIEQHYAEMDEKQIKKDPIICDTNPYYWACKILLEDPAYLSLEHWKTAKGTINEHTTKKVLDDFLRLETITPDDIIDIVGRNANGGTIHNNIAASDTLPAREWLALPKSKELVKLCDLLSVSGWTFGPEQPPLYGILLLCAIQAYINYLTIGENSGSLKIHLLKKYSDKLKAAGSWPEDSDHIKKISSALNEPDEIAKVIFEDRKIAYKEEITINADRIYKILRGSDKAGDSNRPIVKRTEEIITLLQALYKLPLEGLENISPQKGTACKGWRVYITNFDTPVYERIGVRPITRNGERINIFSMVPEVKEYIYIPPELSPCIINICITKIDQQKTDRQILKDARSICAYYYIILKISEAKQAREKEAIININELLKLCGYDKGWKDRNAQNYYNNYIEHNILSHIEYSGIASGKIKEDPGLSGKEKYIKIPINPTKV